MPITKEQEIYARNVAAQRYTFKPARISYAPWTREKFYRLAEQLSKSGEILTEPRQVEGTHNFIFSDELARQGRALGFRVDITLNDPYGNFHIGERVIFT